MKRKQTIMIILYHNNNPQKLTPKYIGKHQLKKMHRFFNKKKKRNKNRK